jgi:preprotein translocase subunit Sss1
MTSVYDDVVEIVASIGMNIIVAIGFIIDYKQSTR